MEGAAVLTHSVRTDATTRETYLGLSVDADCKNADVTHQPTQGAGQLAEYHSACEAIPLADRFTRSDFWAKVVKTDCCWIWTAGLREQYGVAWAGGRPVAAHRRAYELVVGPIPEGKNVLHSCDVRRCVRPEHLRLGTHAENTADMNAKGRRGDIRKRLTEDAVRHIRRARRAGQTLSSLATQYGVSVVAIHLAATGKNWRHVEEEVA